MKSNKKINYILKELERLNNEHEISYALQQKIIRLKRLKKKKDRQIYEEIKEKILTSPEAVTIKEITLYHEYKKNYNK